MRMLLKELKELGLSGDTRVSDIANLIDLYLTPRFPPAEYTNSKALMAMSDRLVKKTKVFNTYILHLNDDFAKVFDQYFVDHLSRAVLEFNIDEYDVDLTVDKLLLICEVAVRKPSDKLAVEFRHLALKDEFNTFTSVYPNKEIDELASGNLDYIRSTAGALLLSDKGQAIFNKVGSLFHKNPINNNGIFGVSMMPVAKLVKMRVETLDQAKVLETLMGYEYPMTESEIKKALKSDSYSVGRVRKTLNFLTRKGIDFLTVGKRENVKTYALKPEIRRELFCGHPLTLKLVDGLEELGVDDLKLLLVAVSYPDPNMVTQHSVERILHENFSLRISQPIIEDCLEGKGEYIDELGYPTNKAVRLKSLMLI